jgi:chemotaxis protein MotB
VRGRKTGEEATHHERWLVSYADFMTLLFALFVVLFASSHHDKKTIQRVSAAVKNGFQDMGAFSYGATLQDSPPSKLQGTAELPGPPKSEEASQTPSSATAGIDVGELRKALGKALGKELERQEVDMRMTPEGFVVSLHELGFFDSGEARLMPGAAEKIKRIASVLNQYGLDMRVEGHSDDVPIHNAEFASNWDLSTARATVVAKLLLDEAGVDPKRISIAGYAQYHPAASNDTPEGRRANRRVDIVVVSSFRQPQTVPR